MSGARLHGWIESLTVTQGQGAGERFRLLPWERRFLAGAFTPGVQLSALSVARANGKTTLTAAVAAAVVAGPLVQARGETILCASSFSQAVICFRHVKAFLGDRLEDRKRYRVQDSQNLASIIDRETGASVKALGSDPGRLHGLAPVLVLADEPAQWPRNARDRMLAALETSLGKHPGSRMIALGDTSRERRTLVPAVARW